MDTNDKIAFVAILIGMGQMGILTNKLVNTKDISYYSTEYVVSGIIASALWTIYQYICNLFINGFVSGYVYTLKDVKEYTR